MEYEDISGKIAEMHCDSQLKNDYRRLASHLWLCNRDLLPRLLRIMNAQELQTRKNYGLEQKLSTAEKKLRDMSNRRKHGFYQER